MAKHLSLDDRSAIRNGLDRGDSFKQIGRELGKDCTTISKEVKNHLVFRKTGAVGRAYNACTGRNVTADSYVRDAKRTVSAGPAKTVTMYAPVLKKNTAPDCLSRLMCATAVLTKTGAPCKNVSTTRSLHIMSIKLSFLKRGKASLFPKGTSGHLDGLVSPLVFKGQSFHHIFANNKDSIMVSEQTLYRLMDYNLFTARNIDLPRKVRYSKRRKKKHYKVDKDCRIGRNYQDFQDFMDKKPDLPVTELDSVEGTKGGKVLLTIHFVKTEMMPAFLRDYNDSQSVIDIINKLYLELRPDRFEKLTPVLLADNGSEFSNPAAMETDSHGNRRTNVFYCNPSTPYEKGSAERNHELIRYVIPKGEPFDRYTQSDISLMMDYINSYSRKSLGDKCPYDIFEFLYGHEFLELPGCWKVVPNDVTLNKSIFKREGLS